MPNRAAGEGSPAATFAAHRTVCGASNRDRPQTERLTVVVEGLRVFSAAQEERLDVGAEALDCSTSCCALVTERRVECDPRVRPSNQSPSTGRTSNTGNSDPCPH